MDIAYDDLTDLYVVGSVSVNGVRYRDKIIAPDLIVLESSMVYSTENNWMQGLTRNVRDLSPIEHARDVIQRRISRRQNQSSFL